MKHNMKNNLDNQYVPQNITRKYHKRKQKRQRRIIGLLIIGFLISSIFFKKYFFINSNDMVVLGEEKQENQYVNTLEQKPNLSEENNNTIDEDSTNKSNNIIVENGDDSSNDTVVESSNKSETNQYDYSKPVPKSKKVNADYFKDAVFIGNSRTESFILNNGLSSKTTSYTAKGLKVDTIFTDKVINKSGKKVTIMEALEDTSFSKVYIMLGINETGWLYSNLFVKKYSEIIDEIRRINPDSIIYVQAILPVSQKVSDEHSYIKNSKINEYNSLIEQMAKDKKVYYVNVKEAIADQNETLPEEAATDGIHLNKKYCKKWLEYLENHIVEEK